MSQNFMKDISWYFECYDNFQHDALNIYRGICNSSYTQEQHKSGVTLD